MRFPFLLFTSLLIASLPAVARAAETIRIAAYNFPPYFSAYDSTEHLVGDLIEALNAQQSDYKFELHDVPSKARFKALSEAGCCNLILFESPEWGWSAQMPHVDVSEPLVFGSERLVALKKENRSATEFFRRDDLRFGGIIGYHYSFLGNRTDAALLEEKYNVYLSLSHDMNLRMLLNGRLDVVMVHDEYLLQLVDKPWFNDLLMKPEPYDEYELHTLINPEKGFTLRDWQQVMQPLIANGTWAKLLQSYKLAVPPTRAQLPLN